MTVSRYTYKPSSPVFGQQIPVSRYTYTPSSPHFDKNASSEVQTLTISETIDSLVQSLMVDDVTAPHTDSLYSEATGSPQLDALKDLVKQMFGTSKKKTVQ
jgi:hypothetical protein